MAIVIDNLTKRYGDTLVLDRLSLRIEAPGAVVVSGASGRGKTTLLRLLAGLERPDRGSVSGVGRAAYMFQEPRLLPWLTAAENVNLVLGDRPETMPTALEWLEKVELADAARQYPDALSGGMQQRVALARALAFGGDTVLLDEPFRALDPPLRMRLFPLLCKAAEEAALIVVSHDPEDVHALGAAQISL